MYLLFYYFSLYITIQGGVIPYDSYANPMRYNSIRFVYFSTLTIVNKVAEWLGFPKPFNIPSDWTWEFELEVRRILKNLGYDDDSD